MKKYAVILIIVLTIIFIIATDTLACSAFSLQYGREHVFGKNYDWYVEGGMVFVKKRHVKKTAIPPRNNIIDSENPATWTSKYGSIIFMQSSVHTGMNEAGLVVTENALHQTVYPEPDSRPSINGTEWLGYLLDNFRSVDEVIASDNKIRIRKVVSSVPLYNGSHYLISDRTGNTAVIEFLEGKMVCYKGGTIMTNSPYAVSKDYEGDQFGSSYDSLERFYRIKMALNKARPTSTKQAVDYAFVILDDVLLQRTMIITSPELYGATRWSIVFDQKNFRIYFKTDKSPGIKEINLKSFDFSCERMTSFFDMDTDLEGDVTKHFVDFRENMDRYVDFVRNLYRQYGYDVPTDSIRVMITEYIDKLICEPEK